LDRICDTDVSVCFWRAYQQMLAVFWTFKYHSLAFPISKTKAIEWHDHTITSLVAMEQLLRILKPKYEIGNVRTLAVTFKCPRCPWPREVESRVFPRVPTKKPEQ
jgi:hypothetical protein